MLCDTYSKGKMESHASVTLKSETSSVLKDILQYITALEHINLGII